MFNILERLSMEAIEAFYFFISLAVGISKHCKLPRKRLLPYKSVSPLFVYKEI